MQTCGAAVTRCTQGHHTAVPYQPGSRLRQYTTYAVGGLKTAQSVARFAKRNIQRQMRGRSTSITRCANASPSKHIKRIALGAEKILFHPTSTSAHMREGMITIELDTANKGFGTYLQSIYMLLSNYESNCKTYIIFDTTHFMV